MFVINSSERIGKVSGFVFDLLYLSGENDKFLYDSYFLFE
jgi:hypothetical protein